MMRSPLLFIFALILAGSLALNARLYFLCRELFARYNAALLDPLALGTYSSEPAAIAGPNTGVRVVIFGDSRAEMWPFPPEPADLAMTFFNRGIGSQTTAQMVLRFDAHVASLHPDWVIIQAGMNDLRTLNLFPERGAEIIQGCKDHLREIIAHSRKGGARVVVTTIFGIGDLPLEWRLFWSDGIEKAIQDVNRDLLSIHDDGVTVLDVVPLIEEEGRPGKIQPAFRLGMDHLNVQGYEVLNRALLHLRDTQGKPVLTAR